MSFEIGKTIPELIIEEIGLEGLEGITIAGLWLRLSDSLNLPLPLVDNFQEQVWSFILAAHKHLDFFILPTPRAPLKIWNRFEIIDPDYGIPVEPDECPYTTYKTIPITDGNIIGSCETYHVRRPVPFDEIKEMSITDVTTKWGETFVIVGSQAVRYNCLVPPNISIPTDITSHQYCVLEFIGRSRRNGVTSAGKYSILQCAKDSAIAFYIIKRLRGFGLIVKQAYTERRSDRLVTSSLITLNRFQSHKKTALLAIIEKIYLAIKQSPIQKLTLASVKALFPPENLSMIKKIMLTQFYRNIFENCTARAGDLPDIKQTPKMNKDREVVCVRLRNPNLSRDELFSDHDEGEEKEPNDFYDYKHSYVDMPLMEEIYRVVEKHGNTGCNRSQLCTIMSANHLNVRQALKKALSDKIITSYCKDVGRQRTHMLVALGCSKSIKLVKEENKHILKNLKCDDEPNIPLDKDPPLKDIPQIIATVKQVTPLPVPENSRDETAKQIDRKQKIVEAINEFCFIQVSVLRQMILKFEQEAGYKDEICNRSLCRTIARLQKYKIVNMFEISLRFDEHARLYRYVTHPKINGEHPVMQREITKLKNALFLYVEDKKFRNSSQIGVESKTKIPRIGLLPLGPHKVPKFLTARFLHEFMFYMLQEMHPDQKPLQLSVELIHEWLESDPAINRNELYESMMGEGVNIYTDKLSWRTFINPLPPNENKPFGWISLPDVVDRLPFSILNKLIRIPPGVAPEAYEYLLHPVRQHYMIKQLPLELQGLINRKRLSYIIISIIRVLHRMGLIQLSEKGGKEALQLWLYINRKARVTDTTTSEPGYFKVSTDREYKNIKFCFETHADVEEFWNCLHKTCIQTKLGFVHKNLTRTSSRAVYNKRRRQLNFLALPVANFEDAPALDTGIPPGDGLGAGGIASILFSSFQRNWTWLVNNKHTAAAVAAQKIKRNAKYIRVKLSKMMSGTGPVKSSFVPPSMTAKKMNRFAVVSTSRVIKRKENAAAAKAKTKFPLDSVDRDALTQMRSLRARWSDQEDMILKMTRATVLFFSVPVLHFNHRDVARITRDIIRMQCGICNKTAETCHRRIQFIVKTSRHLPELPTWLHILQTSEHLTNTYDGDKFFSILKELYPRKSDLKNALYVHFLYIYSYLRVQLNPSDHLSETKRLSTFPTTLTEFYSKYRECTPLNESKTLLHFNPTTKHEVQLITINNVLHSSLCCVRDKTQYNLQIFEIFKTYSEETLHVAFKKARQDGLVVARKKGQVKSYTTQLAGPAYILSNRYRLCLMSLRLPYIVFDMFHAFFDKTVLTIYSCSPDVVEIKSPHSAQLLFMSELLCSDNIQIDIKPPSSMLTIDPTAQQSSTAETDRILTHFHKALESAPAAQYLKDFDALGALAPRIKFKAANVLYRLNYHPFDVVSKLTNIQMHFFCFLANLNNPVDLSFSQFPEQADDINDFCPFTNCIMTNTDYLEAIQTTIMHVEPLLSDIREDCHMETDAMESGIITLGVKNLLAVFGRFDTFMRSKLVEREKRDLGSIAIKPSKLNLLEICRDMTTASDEVVGRDEYEPTLNKEEKIARAQDVFVVNLPKLQISANLEKQDELMQYKGVNVPKHLVDTSLQRDEVFGKVFHNASWEYTNDNLDRLANELDEEGWSKDEQTKIKELHDLIESKEFGAQASDLLEHFPDVDFLRRAIKFLREHYLVLRAGASTFMYVHQNHVRQWVIHSRHIKRLVRESMGKRPLKRKANPTDDEQPAAKAAKTSGRSRRVTKPIERYEDQSEAYTMPIRSDSELLVFKPAPWIRVNGSLNRRVLDRWMASIVIECTLQCGCTVHDICLRFKQMHAVDIMFLLELLVDLNIIELRSMKRPNVGLFSKYQPLEIGVGDEFTDPRKTCVFTAPDAITRMSALIGDKMYQTEFV